MNQIKTWQEALGHDRPLLACGAVGEAMQAEIDALRQAIEQGEQETPEHHLMVEANKYWTQANAKHHGAVQWIQDDSGALLIFTRGEYRDKLMKGIFFDAPTAPAQPAVPSIEAARKMGEQGGPAVEKERLAFEAWMAGHCWALSATWTGTEYRSDSEAAQVGWHDPQAMRTRGLWAAWRDRAALSAAPAQQPLTTAEIEQIRGQ